MLGGAFVFHIIFKHSPNPVLFQVAQEPVRGGGRNIRIYVKVFIYVENRGITDIACRGCIRYQFFVKGLLCPPKYVRNILCPEMSEGICFQQGRDFPQVFRGDPGVIPFFVFPVTGTLVEEKGKLPSVGSASVFQIQFFYQVFDVTQLVYIVPADETWMRGEILFSIRISMAFRSSWYAPFRPI